MPAKLKVLRGNPGRRPIKAHAEPESVAPECPAVLAGEAKAEWDRIVPELLVAGLLARLDRAALAAYCSAYARWVEAELALRTHGVLIKAPSGYPMVSPYLTVANKAMEQMTRLLVEFGMSPSSRSRVTPGEKGKPSSKLDRFLRLA